MIAGCSVKPTSRQERLHGASLQCRCVRGALTLAALLLATTLPAAAAEAQPDWWFTYAIGPVAPDAGTRIAVWVMDDRATCLGAPAVDIDVLMDGELLERLHAEALDPCTDDSPATGPYSIPAGLHEFTIILDPEGNVTESDETNNVLTFRKLFSHDRPDMEIAVTQVDVTGWPAAEFTLHYRVCNVGAATPDKSLAVRAQRNQNHVGEAVLAPLEPGACTTGSMTGRTEFPLQPQWLVHSTHSYEVVVGILPGRLQDETVLENNRATGSFEVTPMNLLQ